jgi:hypothetical protein
MNFKGMNCKTMNSVELETKIIEFVRENPSSTIESIACALNHHYLAIYRLIEGREHSRANTGLVNNCVLKSEPGLNERGNLCWVYSVI